MVDKAILRRVERMERIYDLMRETLRDRPHAIAADAKTREMYRELRNYYENGSWLSDYCADEAGLIPRDLKRGVLSQDGVHSLLEDMRNLSLTEDIMERILFINACVREDSRTLKLARRVIARMDGEVTERILENEDIKPLNGILLRQRDGIIARGETDAPMLRYAREFAAADRIVIAAPYWDLTFPAMLKAYLENITVTGVTFRYESGVPVGMCRAKQLIYVTTAGGPMFVNYGYDYVKTLANVFYGIADTHCFRAENLDVYGADVEGIMAAACADIDAHWAE